VNKLYKAIAETKLLLELKRLLTMIYACPVKQRVCVNFVNFRRSYFDDAHQNKMLTFPNSFSEKKGKDSFVLFFIKPNVEMTEFL